MAQAPTVQDQTAEIRPRRNMCILEFVSAPTPVVVGEGLGRGQGSALFISILLTIYLAFVSNSPSFLPRVPYRLRFLWLLWALRS